MEVFKVIYDGILTTSYIEWIAVTIGIVYLLLIAGKNRWGWWLAFVSSALYVYLSYSVQLYVESFLQVFYVFMAVYGWITWNKAKDDADFVARRPIKWHIFNILISSIISIIVGYLMSQYTNQATPYLDSFTTVFSLAATFLVAHRVLESWLYWIIIDAALIFLYAGQDLYLIAVNYFMYTVIAIIAYLSWSKSFKNQKN